MIETLRFQLGFIIKERFGWSDGQPGTGLNFRPSAFQEEG
jgi:hypothetical protein